MLASMASLARWTTPSTKVCARAITTPGNTLRASIVADPQFDRKNTKDNTPAVINSHRVLHGALLDTELLAEVYLAMTRGQESLLGDENADHEEQPDLSVGGQARLVVRVIQASEEELSLHAQQLADIDKASKGSCLWKQLELGA